MQMNTNSPSKLKKRIKALDFALIDAGLFLNTHPANAKALAYFNKINEARKEAYNEYTESHGPLVMTDNDSSKSWGWIKGPWPWEMED